MKVIIRILVNRITILGLILLIQLVLLIGIIFEFSEYFSYFYIISTVISILMVFYIVNKSMNPVYKIAWIIPILIFPIFGGIFYLFFGSTRIRRRLTAPMAEFLEQKRLEYLKVSEDTLINHEMFMNNKSARIQSLFIQNEAHYPVYNRTKTEYLPNGEVLFDKLKEELKKAEHYIFLEYFIIQEGLMWNSILEILIEKVKSGVDVRVIYDDFGCLKTLPFKYNKKLEKLGIKCKVFNPLVPILTPWLNHRDHRKIAVIDGNTGFTGGINLSDEYINQEKRFGHWKDSTVMLKGDAVWSFTVMFLSLWNYLNHINEDFDRYKPVPVNHAEAGFVQPYEGNPLSDEPVSQNIYLNLINKAEKYIYITTPYLIIDNEMETALSLAAKGGIDVRILTPAIPDKFYVHEVTRSFYSRLIKNGVKIYEYTPGFIHAKTFAVDDIYAVVGSINLDYRSLYLHFECAVWLYRTGSVIEVKNDFLKTLEESRFITLKESQNVKWYRVLFRLFVREFSPLM